MDGRQLDTSWACGQVLISRKHVLVAGVGTVHRLCPRDSNPCIKDVQYNYVAVHTNSATNSVAEMMRPYKV